MPSVQLQRYLQTRANGGSIEDACAASGIDAREAALHEADIESGELTLPHVHVHVSAREDEPEESEMAREDVKTSISVNGGPQVAIDLGKDLDAPENAAAKEQMSGMFSRPGTAAGENLKRYIERVERLEEEIKGLNSDKSDVFQEMKSNGFDPKTVKRILKLRKMGSHERQEAEALLSTYMDAIGMTPIETAIALAA